eukprot:scaffold23726_cov130-Isochrysis_galbana.AAC.5
MGFAEVLGGVTQHSTTDQRLASETDYVGVGALEPLATTTTSASAYGLVVGCWLLVFPASCVCVARATCAGVWRAEGWDLTPSPAWAL